MQILTQTWSEFLQVMGLDMCLTHNILSIILKMFHLVFIMINYYKLSAWKILLSEC